ncbi:zinc ribbon domain-containing protein [Natronococcus sp. A-GB1]|uniref:DUF7575 domain-containing protein n=1 Tax=Natronococcus amylolyticus DSM 10524 TaxID=1227497 RepID=L9XI57_9EURY|nr:MULTISPECIES: zinc ribbon domain-containing protein [Natronococcus]ELY60358.1 hypothetical protein C491_03650 [Natronococcus amylolyticus DSM 10524]MDG5759174.1 zinc ribbon domain-containing protein [Natronococcus sp. A-GB1]
MTWIRALAAAGLSVLLPGAGHVFIRDWIRGLAFGGIFVASLAILFPTDQIAAADSLSGAVSVITTETDTISQFVISFIILFAAIDATFRSMGFPPGSNNGADHDGPSCPHCGKPLDEDLTFCHWCTTRLEPANPDEDEPTN